MSKKQILTILAMTLYTIAIAQVVGIQQCTPPFDMDTEHYFWKIESNRKEFIEKYDDWIKEGL